MSPDLVTHEVSDFDYEWLNPRQNRPSKQLWQPHPHHMIEETGSHDSLRQRKGDAQKVYFGVPRKARHSLCLAVSGNMRRRRGRGSVEAPVEPFLMEI